MSSIDIPIDRPEGATHWACETLEFNAVFAKFEEGRWFVMTPQVFASRVGGWVYGSLRDDPARYIELPALPVWINYAEERPQTAGAYRWRVESIALPGMFVTFVAHMRKRGAGGQDVLSPSFDYWDGHRVSVPAGVQWQPLRPEDPQDVTWSSVAGVEVEGLSPLPCPYCLKTPKWDALMRHAGGGVNLHEPYRFNNWRLACCGWGSTPSLPNPIELVKRRDSVLSRITPKPTEGTPV